MKPVDVDFRRRVIRAWLVLIAALVFAMVVVGGATRLTESGLSITEWQPVTGTLPPLSAAEWQAEFDKYKAIPQYMALNSRITLDGFKTIFWWEWSHRLLGRVIGAAFLLPFLWFLWRGWVEPGLRGPLWTIFGLGALQGVAGWWMVASGLAGRVEVSEYRLAAHLVLACLIYIATVWTVARIAPRPPLDAPWRARASAAALVLLVLVQIYFGALLAGLRGGPDFPTWPLIDGALMPDIGAMLTLQPLWRNLFENVLTVQVEHRLTADALWLAAIVHAVDVWRTMGRGAALSGAFMLALALTIQAAFGILTLIYETPLALALAHQAMAMVALTIAVVHAQRLFVRQPNLGLTLSTARPLPG
jgi:cytochrome c oxidase assembly protein subunit 15